MLTVKEVASRLRVSVGAVYKAVNDGRLRCHRIGSAIRISEDDFASFLTATASGGVRETVGFRHITTVGG